MSNRLNEHDSSVGAALTVVLGMDENSEQPVEIWVSSSAAATFDVSGSADGTQTTAAAAIADDFIVVADFEDVAPGDTIYINGESKVVDRLVEPQKRIYLTVALTAAHPAGSPVAWNFRTAESLVLAAAGELLEYFNNVYQFVMVATTAANNNEIQITGAT
jgi:hypothetical protein